MFLKAMLGIPVCNRDGRRDYICLVCAFETDEQCYFMEKDGFDDIYDLLCSAVELHKGQGWKVDSDYNIRVVEFLYDDAPVDLSTLGYLRLA
ncbi:Hypothetical protein ZAZAV_251 [Cedratvirus Zaza IHUMI]|uniref:Uncharacterized protein n=1 Tax=Cedratvirus Zaza IHUMI TaxID=2126979 RepID=A0A2R8FE57_9VIRU|nr:Hypothetical protein ZAZAV_251 [Cedratvirus Zaza IHUMI]